jgi:Ca2+-binding RTX toxin-like protein
MLEHLETRRHFSISAIQNDGVLQITGSDASDDVSIDVQDDTVVVTAESQSTTYLRVIDIQFDAGAGDDTVTVTLEHSTPGFTIDAGDGDDSVSVTSVEGSPLGLLSIDAGEGDDSVDCSASCATVQINGDAGDDTLIGSRFDDVIAGGDGNDVIVGNYGSDDIDAGTGSNFVSGMGDQTSISIEPIGPDDYAPTVVETYPGFYEVTGDGHNDNIAISVSQSDGTFTLNGTTFGNVLFIEINTNAGDDSVSVISSDGNSPIGTAISTGDGNDAISTNVDAAIDGGAGKDRITMSDAYRGVVHGGDGNDVITLKGLCADSVALGDDGKDLIDASSNSYAVEIRGGIGDDTIYGSPGADFLYGEDGNDRVFGLAGADLVDGGSGTDYLDGGDGDDLLYAGSGWTVLGGAGNDTLYVFVLDGTSSGVEQTFIRNN